MKTSLIHTLNDSLELRYQNQTLFRYPYTVNSPAFESPKPYFHPLKTLDGSEVTLACPHDHLWHTGLSMSLANLSGENFWGGPTYTREAGYVQLENNGSIQHTAWLDMQCGEEIHCTEQLRWITGAGDTWIDETRQINVREIEPQAGYWSLDLAFRLVNVAQQPLVFGSPTTEGRPAAGYGSLFWRGPRSFLYGQILADHDLEGPTIMGQRSTWLAFIGSHDGNRAQSTILFIDQPGNPRYPNKWFVRNDPYACVSCSFMFDEYYTLAPDEVLELTYRVIIANGAWSRSQIERYIAAQ